MKQQKNKPSQMIRCVSTSVLALLLATLSSNLLAESLQDPTRPLFQLAGAPDQSEQGLKLESILVAGKRKVAVINGQPVTEAQSVNGARIEKIFPDRVIVLHQGKTKSLSLITSVRSVKP
ncbi:MAG: hypothetical protein AseanaTS_16920 [Candidatus Pelagadaptatus aseana]|uniref:hypothetical protein n=1 Tax=Candidatus Pelagadaptatus aseana TaxID=3120508 RepID=UPI0039B28A10